MQQLDGDVAFVALVLGLITWQYIACGASYARGGIIKV